MLCLTWFIAILINFSLIQIQGMVPERFNQPLVTLSVQKGQICANRGDSLTLSCTLAVHGTKKSFKKWTLSWYSEGIITKNVTEKRQNSSHLTTYLRLNAVWSGDKFFTCVASRFANNAKTLKAFLNSSSLVKVKSPVPCNIIGFRLMERPLLDSLDLYWRPVTSSENVEYSLNICTEPAGLLLNKVCPYYKTIPLNSSCFHREKDVYNLPNTKGFTCMAMDLDLRTYEFRAYISSKVDGEICEHRCSAEKRFQINHFRNPFLEPDITEVVLTPTPVVRLRVIPRAPREVTLIWSDSSLVHYTSIRMYRVRYKCSEDSTWNMTACLFQPKLTLNSASFQNYRPYDLCRFCVTATVFLENGLDSKPLCKDIRLQEEPPSSGPNIACPGNKCQSTRDAHARNVSITWTLPPRRDWKGVLTEVRILYRNGLEKSSENSSDYPNSIKIPIRNNTTNSQTLLTGLSVNQTYWVAMVACNKEGCSHPGKALTLPPLQLLSSHVKRGDPGTDLPKRKTIILVACIAAVLLTAYLAYVSYTCVQTRKQLGPKIEIKLCEPSGYDAIMNNEEKVEYDVLVVSNLARYVDIRQLTADKTQPKRSCDLTADSGLHS